MSKEEDRIFVDTFMIVLGVLVVFTILVYFLANAIGNRTQARFVAENPLQAQLVAARLAPVATVVVEGQAAPPAPQATTAAAPEPEPTTVAAAEMDGKTVYESACLACHMAAVAGAPKFGDPEVWAPRIAQGVDVLYDHAINGFQGEVGMMIAKGGRLDLSDNEVRAAVDYMVEAAR